MQYILRYNVRPWTVNHERTLHHQQRAKLVKEWREAFFWLAKEQKIPRLAEVRFVVTPYLKDRRMQDVGACLPAAKAAIDGLVDAGVLEDDNPKFVKFLGFNCPVVGQGNGLELLVESCG